MWLQDAIVYDPFMGGGTSLVESARMGASVFGRDVDPIAVAVVNLEIRGLNTDFDETSAALVLELEKELKQHFDGPDPEWTPLHWFWLLKPSCPECNNPGLLYKDLIIATSTGRRGAVVRDSAMHAFCPSCLTVHELERDSKELNCCGQSQKVDSGTFTRGKYVCPQCGKASSHEELKTGSSERILIAVEETHAGSYRRIRSATPFDRELTSALPPTQTLSMKEFDVQLETERRDRRPVSAGYSSLRALFTARQWAVFTSAFAKIRSASLGEDLERELTLMLTGALASNNILCGYARDYGRLAPLFSVRGFSFPVLTVELNPFHPTAGRGTLRSARARMLERADTSVRRSRVVADEVQRLSFDLPVKPAAFSIICRSADDDVEQRNSLANVCVTDPPYFDYIAYSELSEFFRLWLREPNLAGAPLLPENDAPVESFATGLGGALKATLIRLAPDTPLVFTYHSSNSDAWRAIGEAFDIADLAVVALWPILADPHMGHHAAEGNCEWDVVVVARRIEEVVRISEEEINDLPQEWLTEIESSEFSVGRGDRSSFEHAWTMGRTRYARLRNRQDPSRKRS
jgi:putative DNA methylase